MLEHEYQISILNTLLKLAMILALPAIILFYCSLFQLTFAQVDNGMNHHKLLILSAYLVVLAAGYWAHKRLQRLTWLGRL